MSRVNRFMRRGAIAGLVAAAASVAVTSTAMPAAAAGRPTLTAAPVPAPGDKGGDNPLACLLFEYNLGPFGPLGPWGPYGPLKNDKHPLCVGGGPAFNN